MRMFICGFRTVGQGFAEVLIRRNRFLEEKYRRPAIITGIMDSRTTRWTAMASTHWNL